ncbi:MAG TPA: hypothetical protein PKM44_06865 [Turneriella sp.]|nr:hypothetical protein [Turneriella sp.]HNE19153.1 hypothetical protein [Turneriella sp.]HNL10215.1 hypothetical protein [Turneriella sp.]
MMMTIFQRIFSSRIVAGAILLVLSCTRPQAESQRVAEPGQQFQAYWNAGKAELARYELRQARYGQVHPGEMVVITVTEPFRTDRQVKAESAEGAQHAVNVLKVQQMRRFATGIYDYALTTTSFRPFAAQPAAVLKVTGSAVDWCGHAWLQLNRRKDSFAVESRSYFENPGDMEYSVSAALSEDEIWQRIRTNPAALPVGKITVVPSLMSARLRHRATQVETARAELQQFARLKQTEYSLVYGQGQDDERQVAFIFESEFPHRVLEYRELYSDVIGGGGKKDKLSTVARLKKTILSPYWQQHDLIHKKDRKDFGVRGFD